MLGREFEPAEDVPGGPAVCILNYGLWKNVFNGDPAVIGRAIQLRGEAYTVVGVLPDHFPITERTSFPGGQGIDLWTPLRPSTSGEGGGINYSTVARLRNGVSWAEADADLQHASPLAFVNVPEGQIAELTITPMQQAMTEGIRDPLLMLWGAVGIVLLIACVNIAGLLLARGATRTREIATRMALGSGRAAVIRPGGGRDARGCRRGEPLAAAPAGRCGGGARRPAARQRRAPHSHLRAPAGPRSRLR
jgi:hypothetical protein